MTERWTDADIPDQTGRTVLVTGANSGLGLRTAEVLASKGARVLLACRSAERGAKALDIVKTAAAGAGPELIPLDLSELASVRAAAATARDLTGDGLDVLVNNAGVMATARGRTADGFELQFGTNYLGHAALTWLLMPALRGRVVTLSSLAAVGARIHLDDPNGDHRRYNAAAAYGQSKLADQVFALELDRRLRAAGSDVISVAAHPGYTATGLGSGMARSYSNPVVRSLIAGGHRAGEVLFAQNTRIGALPQLYAATADGVEGGGYFGPRGLGNLRGYPAAVPTVAAARSESLGSALWELTAKLTGITPDPA
ncbi:NAD(P)-dependent dehydrogenase, short-chain alcohol dehydrogenase family [Amycolatopsis pretoriensis]|uniref:NAD(P)-dependent dehydrogenase, short-chain alcohol dehydrogenase family n=1 Tax=Amycolatopsis pretoriensis TaxID=218821 RepID=A0A1H5RJG5_9PSEU|nr:oxidoreductase [Amycolatopsis pretoriensis]SEF38513.1 NAD(P)-dependent dehydrogenase, short-chain alcohol dehydrogenase family [Amycolatopsis pretoriensis]